MKIISRILNVLALVAAVFVMTSSSKSFTVYMIGDSTMADKDMNKGTDERGWGMVLQGFFTENVCVDNHAVNGRSSRSFIAEGRWQRVYDQLKPGDFLVVQFGHNDEKIDSLRHTEVGKDFDENYRIFVRGAIEKGATPIVMNCVARRNFFKAKTREDIDDEALRSVNRDKYTKAEKINSDTLVDTHGEYRNVPERIAREFGVAFVNANAISVEVENALGVEGSRELHMIKYNGKDNTHYNSFGAHVMASRLVDAMAEKCPALKPYVRHYDYVVSAKGRGNYLTLQAAVDAVPDGVKAEVLVLDGTWKKPCLKGKEIKFVKRSSAKIR